MTGYHIPPGKKYYEVCYSHPAYQREERAESPEVYLLSDDINRSPQHRQDVLEMSEGIFNKVEALMREEDRYKALSEIYRILYVDFKPMEYEIWNDFYSKKKVISPS